MGGPGFRLEVHEALASTSDLVAERAVAGEPAGLAVLARRQTAGRGTQGRGWESPAGNLYMTTLLRPGGALRDAPQWSLLAGVALAEAVAPLLPDPGALALKWPNDLLLRGRKLAGILAEASASAKGGVAWISLGIGVNLAAAPVVPGRETASLAGEGIVPPAPTAFAVQLLERLDQWCTRRAARGFADVRSAWLRWGPAPDALIRVSAPGGGTRSGRFAGLAEDGSLLIADDGRVQRLAAGGGHGLMLLAIDAGNTNVVFAVHDGSEWRGRWRIATRPDRTSDEYGVWLLALLQHVGLKPTDIGRAVIGTVVPAALYNLRRLARDWFHCEPLIARSTVDWGFAIKVDNPSEVGADRLLNALSSHRKYGGPLVVIDFGTATTFDVVDHDGAYLGGVIAPGINLSIEALHRAAARLPRIGIGRPQGVIGRSTIPAMQSGIYWGYVGLIEGIVSRVKAEYGRPMKVVATGGLAPLFAEGTMAIETTDADITLEGLRLLAERNPAPIFHRSELRDPLRVEHD